MKITFTKIAVDKVSLTHASLQGKVSMARAGVHNQIALLSASLAAIRPGPGDILTASDILTIPDILAIGE